jgi:putative oxidoreductase
VNFLSYCIVADVRYTGRQSDLETCNGGKEMSVDVGIMLVRVLFGAAIAAHGSQKLFGVFGGYGLKGTGGFFESLGFRPGVLLAALAGLGELVGGLLLVLGLLTPVGAAAVLATMIVAMVSVHLKNGFFATNNGIEMPFLFAAAALGIAVTGGGAYSLDAQLGYSAEPYTVGVLLALTLVGAGLTLGLRRHEQSQAVPTQR